MTRCPKCQAEIDVKNKDHFEDMYTCTKCWHFWYPEELGLLPDSQAGYLKLRTSPQGDGAGE